MVGAQEMLANIIFIFFKLKMPMYAMLFVKCLSCVLL